MYSLFPRLILVSAPEIGLDMLPYFPEVSYIISAFILGASAPRPISHTLPPSYSLLKPCMRRHRSPSPDYGADLGPNSSQRYLQVRESLVYLPPSQYFLLPSRKITLGHHWQLPDPQTIFGMPLLIDTITTPTTNI